MLAQAGKAGQTLITTTDLNDFGPELLSRATLVRVERGALTPDEHDDPNPATRTSGRPTARRTQHRPSLRRVAEQPFESPTRTGLERAGSAV